MKDKNKKSKEIKIMIFGTFDGVHRGHLNFFKQARALKILVPGQAKKMTAKPFLIVSVARDENVFRIKKFWPLFSEKKRMALVKKYKLVDKVVLGGLNNHLPHIAEERPDVIALGYDQKAYVKNLRKDLKKQGLNVKVVRLKAYKADRYKNEILKRKNLLA